MSTNQDLAVAGYNYRPTPWEVDKSIFYWGDPLVTPDIPPPKEWALIHKNTKPD